jgi:hypothetical protein
MVKHGSDYDNCSHYGDGNAVAAWTRLSGVPRGVMSADRRPAVGGR